MWYRAASQENQAALRATRHTCCLEITLLFFRAPRRAWRWHATCLERSRSTTISTEGGETQVEELQKDDLQLELEPLEERIAPSGNIGQLGYEGQPGNQGNGTLGYEGHPGNQGGH